MIKLVVGLGNPGSQYEKTRHNAGFLFLDQLAERFGARWTLSSQFQAEFASFVLSGHKLLLLKPMTFMNRSGLSVSRAVRFYKIEPESLLVVHDELDLPWQVIRLKQDGGHAGHNGLRDIIGHLGAKNFYRLRIGIGRPVLGRSVAEYVLSPFVNGELVEMRSGCEGLLANGLDAILKPDVSVFNRMFGAADKK